MSDTIYHTLNLRSYACCPKLYSRLVWQVLFNFYRKKGGDLIDMDSLLCDLYILKDHFEDHLHDLDNAPTLYWEMSPKTGWTELLTFRTSALATSLKIVFNQDSVVFYGEYQNDS